MLVVMQDFIGIVTSAQRRQNGDAESAEQKATLTPLPPT
jgi:hypothetical protein